MAVAAQQHNEIKWLFYDIIRDMNLYVYSIRVDLCPDWRERCDWLTIERTFNDRMIF